MDRVLVTVVTPELVARDYSLPLDEQCQRLTLAVAKAIAPYASEVRAGEATYVFSAPTLGRQLGAEETLRAVGAQDGWLLYLVPTELPATSQAQP